MRKQWKGFLSGIFVSVLVVGMVSTAVATVGQRTVYADYNDIKVTLNGGAVDLVDANGAAVEPFAINGTTYLPVRAVASALGLHVEWDGVTSTVKLTSKTDAASGTLIMNKNNVKVYYNGITSSSFQVLDDETLVPNYEINLRIENMSNKNYRIRAEGVSVNGIMIHGYLSSEVYAGKVVNSCIEFYGEDLAKNGVDKIDTAEFRLNIYDSDDWSNEFYSDIIKI